MARQLITSIEIDAPPNIVWDVLTDFTRFDQWNPFIHSVNGEATRGAQLQVQLHPPGGDGMKFRPVVLVAEAERELRWLGRFLFPGVFDGEHSFQIVPLSDRQVRFVHSEVFSGLLVPFFWRSLDTQTREGFEAMNRALKLRAEHYSSAA
jgi:hypothetical protein